MTAAPIAVTTSGDARTLPAVPNWVMDAAFVLIMVGLGLVGFRPIYGGHEYLVLGLVGALLGVAVTEISLKLRQPVLAETTVTVLVFLVFGGVATTGRGFPSGLLPTASTIRELGHVGVYGWKELLTTAPPIGDSSNLLAIPYVIGLVGGVAGQSLARRTRRVSLPLLGPGLVLALSILFGARHPASLALQGSLFGLLALGWVIVRFQRTRILLTGPGFGRNRLLLSVAVLALVGVSAGTVGPNLPGAGGHRRVVLSQYVVPPFSADQQPSPLAGFRQYVQHAPLNKAVLFTVTGLAPGSSIRIATMDEYDGVAWGFGAASTSPGHSSDVFQRYGSTIQTGAGGKEAHVDVTVGQLTGAWLPEVGELTHVSFVSSDPSSLPAGFRYDTDIETAAVPSGVAAGDTYSFDALVQTPLTGLSTLDKLSAGDAQISVSGVPPVLQADADSWSAGAPSPYAKVMAIANHLRITGYFSDGLEPTPLAMPGHTTGRLTGFLEGSALVGNDIVGDGEQYAAAFALMANAIGVPARVVLGATVGDGGVVMGADVQPWVEIDLAGVGWQPIYANQFMDPSRKAHQTPPVVKPADQSAVPVEPPVISAIHSPLDDQLPGATSSSLSHFSHPSPKHSHLPAWVVTFAEWTISLLILIGALTTLITSLKLRRRHRRRTTGTPVTQISGAWRELIDLTRDIGVSVPAGRTRREQAGFITSDAAVALAQRGDAAVFGPGQPSPNEVAEYWLSIDRLAVEIRSGLGRLARWRARLSLRSFLPLPSSQAAS